MADHTQQIHKADKDISVLQVRFDGLEKSLGGLKESLKDNHDAVIKTQDEIKALFTTEVFPRLRKVETRQVWMMGVATGAGALLKGAWDWITGSNHH